jgi:hypothetical protein
MSNSDDSTPVIPEGWTASTNLNSSIRTYADVAHRVKIRLGYPSNDINASDEAIANHINEAVELYTRYAGYDEEYVIFCDSALTNGCEIKLDDLVDQCYACGNGDSLIPDPSLSADPASDPALSASTFISATSVTDTLLGSSNSYVGMDTSVSSSSSQVVNAPTESIDISELEVTFDPTNPWDFSVCDANRVIITPLSSYAATESLSPVMDAWVTVTGGIGQIYPPNWEGKDQCLPLDEWWGLSGLSGFDPTTATHAIITNVPACTVGGLQSLELNTGRAASFRTKDKKLDTCGYIPAQVEFVINHNPPTGLSGSFGVEKNTGFKLILESEPDQFQDTNPILMDVDFYQSLSSFEYGTKYELIDTGFNDIDLGSKRKVVDVFFTDPTGKNHGDLLFNFEYAFMQDIFGYDGMGNRIRSQGYDLVTYDLSRQFLETVDKYFGGRTIGHQFNKRTQTLRINQGNHNNYAANSCYLIGIHLERSIADILPERWITDFVTAMTKITIGNTLTKFGGATTLGGLTINGNDVLSQGIQEKEELLKWLREDNSEGGFDKPVYIY